MNGWGTAGGPRGPLVKLPGLLTATIRMISPKPSVTMAR